MTTFVIRSIACAAVACAMAAAPAADWPRFRGPDSRGVAADDPRLPTRWSDTTNVRWRASLDGRGWSSPIVFGGRVIVTAAIPPEPPEDAKPGLYFGGERPDVPEGEVRWVVTCLEASTGLTLWETVIARGPAPGPIHVKNSYASETPVSDGERIYAAFAVDASVRITLIDRDVPSYFQSLEHLLRYCARPPFALERLSVMRGEDGRIACVRYVLPRHKAANWVGPGRGRKSTRPGASGVVELSPFEFLDRLADLVPPPRKHRHRYHGVFAPNHKLRSAVTALAIGNVGKPRDAATGGHAVGGHAADGDATCHGCDSCDKLPSHDTSRIAWAKLMARVGEEFPLECPGCGGDIRLIAFITDPGPIRKILTHLGEPLEPPPVSPARGPPTDWGELVQVHDECDVTQTSPDELPVIDIRSL